MLLNLFLTTTAVIVNALVINPNATSTTTLPLLKRTAFTRPYSYPIPNTNNDNTYTVQEMDQFREGHVDALYTCSVVIREAARNPARYDRILREYFKPADRNLVLNVFKAIQDYSGAKQGNPRLSEINIVDDFPPGNNFNADKHCTFCSLAWTVPPFRNIRPSEIILCPLFFDHGTINGGPGREWPGAPPVTCNTIGTRVSDRMDTLGHHLLHEYTHLIEIVEPVLGGRTEDHAYDFYACRNLDKALATKNADSYAAFATELMWTTECGRDFDPPRAYARS